MNNICTWICLDQKGEESIFPQTGVDSSSSKHQNIYWRCILVFFITSKRVNKTANHVLFTNTLAFPTIDGISIKQYLEKLGVETVFVPFTYKTPKGYWGTFQNQFYEFSILDYLAVTNVFNNEDLYLILDSDCIFTKSIDELFKSASDNNGFASIEEDCLDTYTINGLSGLDMKAITQELLGKSITDVPKYHLGEFLLCSVGNIKKIVVDFKELWPILLKRNEDGLLKFNEEAHTLSYLYYKNALKGNVAKNYIKRIWTNPVFFRNVEPTDVDLAIWHLPSEKRFGFESCYDYLVHQVGDAVFSISNDEFNSKIYAFFSVPKLTLKRHLSFYALSYWRAFEKRMLNFIK